MLVDSAEQRVPPTTLAERLAEAEAADPAFGESLRTIHQQVGATEGGVANQISGTASGGISF